MTAQSPQDGDRRPGGPDPDDPPRRFVFLAGTGFDSIVSGRARHLAEGLARRGHQVSFVELPSVRVSLMPPFHFGPRREKQGGVQVIRLWPFPSYVRLCRTQLAQRWEARAARRLAEWIPDLAESVLVVPTPRWVSIAAQLPAALRCYDYIDHVEVQAGPGGSDVFLVWDEQLLRMSDLVTAVAEPLRAYLTSRVAADRISLVANGVPAEWVGIRVEAVPRASLVRRPDRLIAGFLGSLYEWIDVDLLARTARSLPEVEFVLVGPTRRGVSLKALQGIPNLHRRGPVPFPQVPRVLAAFDVCLIPFRRDAIAEFADPLKVYEYCALGKPVVSTVAFGAADHPAPIAVGEDAEAFAAAIRSSPEQNGDTARDERLAYAAEHTWERRVEELLDAVDRAAQRVR